MKKTILRTLIGLLMLIPVGLIAQADLPIETPDQTIVIDCSPNVLNIGSQGTVFTIHTDIKYYLVSGATCSLNGLEIDWWKSDDRGYFVAKFNIDAVKGLDLVMNDYNTLTMTGVTINGETFSGSQEIMVVNVVPKKK